MPKDKLKTIYVCTQCGETSPRWLGRCPSCGAWNTMTEDVVAEPAKASGGKAAAAPRVTGQTSLVAQKLKNISTTEEKSRIITGISELDRVLGGGIVIGSVTLIGGEPGIGKSTILLQLCGEVSKTRNVLYITGEESVRISTTSVTPACLVWPCRKISWRIRLPFAVSATLTIRWRNPSIDKKSHP